MFLPIWGELEATNGIEEAGEDAEGRPWCWTSNQPDIGEKHRPKPKELQHIWEKEADVDPTQHRWNRKPHRCNMEIGASVVVQKPVVEMLVPHRSEEKCADVPCNNGKLQKNGSHRWGMEDRPRLMEAKARGDASRLYSKLTGARARRSNKKTKKNGLPSSQTTAERTIQKWFPPLTEA